VDEVHANFAARQRGLIRALTDGTPHRAIANRPPASARPARGSKSKGNDRPHRSRDVRSPRPRTTDEGRINHRARSLDRRRGILRAVRSGQGKPVSLREPGRDVGGAAAGGGGAAGAPGTRARD